MVRFHLTKLNYAGDLAKKTLWVKRTNVNYALSLGSCQSVSVKDVTGSRLGLVISLPYNLTNQIHKGFLVAR